MSHLFEVNTMFVFLEKSLSGEIENSAGMARLGEPVRLLINLISKDTSIFLFIMQHEKIFRRKKRLNEKQTQYCPSVLASPVRYNVIR